MTDEQYNCIQAQIAQLDRRDQDFDRRIRLIEDNINPIPFETGVFGFVSNSAHPSFPSHIMNGLMGYDLDGLFVAGDHVAVDMASSLALYAYWENQDKYFPAFGEAELAMLDDGAAFRERFEEWFGDKNYYSHHFEKGNVDLFVLNSGLDAGDAAYVEPDGHTIGSVQYQWLVNAISESTARWKIVMVHRPIFYPQTVSPDPTNAYEVLDWSFEHLGVHLVINGHQGVNAHFRRGSLDYVNVSVGHAVPQPVNPDVETDPLQILGASGAYCPWVDDSVVDGENLVGAPAYGIITATETALTVNIYKASNNTLLHTFTR